MLSISKFDVYKVSYSSSLSVSFPSFAIISYYFPGFAILFHVPYFIPFAREKKKNKVTLSTYYKACVRPHVKDWDYELEVWNLIIRNVICCILIGHVAISPISNLNPQYFVWFKLDITKHHADHKTLFNIRIAWARREVASTKRFIVSRFDFDCFGETPLDYTTSMSSFW